jgi:hypothetical protein
MFCSPILTSGLASRMARTKLRSSGMKVSSLTRRLKELREGSTTAASTTMAPRPPLAMRW